MSKAQASKSSKPMPRARAPDANGSQATSPKDNSKAAMLMGLLSRSEGASLAQMSQASGWMPHSVRGFMAGALKHKHGVSVTSEKGDGQPRVYRILAGTSGE